MNIHKMIKYIQQGEKCTTDKTITSVSGAAINIKTLEDTASKTRGLLEDYTCIKKEDIEAPLE